MSYSVSVNPDAEREVERAKNWYNAISPDLGDKFEQQLAQQLSSLKDNPRIHAIRYGKMPTALLKRFPFRIHFVVNEYEKTVTVYNILHESINPNQYPRS